MKIDLKFKFRVNFGGPLVEQHSNTTKSGKERVFGWRRPGKTEILVRVAKNRLDFAPKVGESPPKFDDWVGEPATIVL